MKKKFKSYILLFGIFVIIFGCEDYNKLTPPVIDPGNADFSRFVSIGNSFTAGYQSGSLFESAQMYSFGKQIADVMGVNYEQPLISEPGTTGRLEIQSLSPFVLYTDPNTGKPVNLSYPKPYNNLGVPGALLYDVANATNSTNCASALFANSPNPMFDIILRNSALNIGTQLQQTAALKPTFITLWIGNNDVLGYATSGGVSPSAPTDIQTFTALYTGVGNAIASFGANVVVANIPDVTSIPFFTTVGPQVALNVPWSQLALLGVPGLFYQQHGETGPATVFADSLSLLTGNVLLTLKGSSYAGYIGAPSGKFYRDFGFPGLPPGIDTTQAFGVHPQNPWPDALILDTDEISVAVTTTNSYNGVIASIANSNGFGLVDINTYFKTFVGGKVINGITFSTMFVEGNLFSLDGVHPTSQGQGIIANEFIKVINNSFGAKLPLIDVSTIPGSLKFAGKLNYDQYGYAKFPVGAFDHLFF